MYETVEEWFKLLQELSRQHGRNILDFDAWTENWENESPNEAYYKEYPEDLADNADV